MVCKRMGSSQSAVSLSNCRSRKNTIAPPPSRPSSLLYYNTARLYRQLPSPLTPRTPTTPTPALLTTILHRIRIDQDEGAKRDGADEALYLDRILEAAAEGAVALLRELPREHLGSLRLMLNQPIPSRARLEIWKLLLRHTSVSGNLLLGVFRVMTLLCHTSSHRRPKFVRRRGGIRCTVVAGWLLIGQGKTSP